jgi:hypothetical protein
VAYLSISEMITETFGVIKSLYPQLVSFARKKLCSVNQFLLWNESRSFFLPLSQIAFQQLLDLKVVISSSPQPSNGHDEWIFVWRSDQFSCSKVYSFLQGSYPVCLLFKWMWKSRVQNKHKFFFWLFLWDRINTWNLLQRKNMFLSSYTCVMCVENVVEDIQHLFFGCPSSDACWTYLGVYWDLSLEFQAMVLHARIHLNSVISREIFIIGC